MVFSSCPCCDVHIFKLVRLCVGYSLSSWYMRCSLPTHAPQSTTQITQWHTTKCKNWQKILQHRVANLAFFWPFGLVANICFYFWKFGLICIWSHIPEFKQSKCFYVHSHNTLPFLTVENIQVNIPNLENGDSQWRTMITVMTSIDGICDFQFVSWTRQLKLMLIHWAVWSIDGGFMGTVRSVGWLVSSIFKWHQTLAMALWNYFTENICL